jgi:hypothetical protein
MRVFGEKVRSTLLRSHRLIFQRKKISFWSSFQEYLAENGNFATQEMHRPRAAFAIRSISQAFADVANLAMFWIVKIE